MEKFVNSTLGKEVVGKLSNDQMRILFGGFGRVESNLSKDLGGSSSEAYRVERKTLDHIGNNSLLK